MVPPLWPGVGIEDEHPGKRRSPNGDDQLQCVARSQPDIVKSITLDRGQGLGEAVDERLSANKADVAPRHGLSDQMFAAAETDLQPDLARREGEQRRAIARRSLRDLQFRQALADQSSLKAAERLAMHAA